MKLSDNCSLCALAQSENDRVVASDERTLSVLHEDRATPGHSMLVWRGHVENISDLSEDEALHFIRSYCRLELALLQSLKCDRAVILKLGLLVPHLHVHIYPISRSESRADVMEMIEARRRYDPAPGQEEALLRQLRLALQPGQRTAEGRWNAN